MYPYLSDHLVLYKPDAASSWVLNTTFLGSFIQNTDKMVGLVKAVSSVLAIGSGSFLANAGPIVLGPRSTSDSETFSIKAPLVVQTSSGIGK